MRTKHQLFYRREGGSPDPLMFLDLETNQSDPDRNIIHMADEAAKFSTPRGYDGVLYKVDGKTEYFVSTEFFRFAN